MGKVKKVPKGKILNNIRRIRVARTDLTQVDLALKVGATRQTIIAIEQGKYAPSMELAFRIVRVFGVSFDEVFVLDPEG